MSADFKNYFFKSRIKKEKTRKKRKKLTWEPGAVESTCLLPIVLVPGQQCVEWHNSMRAKVLTVSRRSFAGWVPASDYILIQVPYTRAVNLPMQKLQGHPHYFQTHFWFLSRRKRRSRCPRANPNQNLAAADFPLEIFCKNVLPNVRQSRNETQGPWKSPWNFINAKMYNRSQKPYNTQKSY